MVLFFDVVVMLFLTSANSQQTVHCSNHADQ
jgi:hypothetical protein